MTKDKKRLDADDDAGRPCSLGYPSPKSIAFRRRWPAAAQFEKICKDPTGLSDKAMWASRCKLRDHAADG